MAHMKTEHPEFKEIKTLAMLRTAFGMSQLQVAREAGVTLNYISNYERNKYVAEYAKEKIEAWVNKHNTESQP